jgi:hypothetical protein
MKIRARRFPPRSLTPHCHESVEPLRGSGFHSEVAPRMSLSAAAESRLAGPRGGLEPLGALRDVGCFGCVELEQCVEQRARHVADRRQVNGSQRVFAEETMRGEAVSGG